MLMKTDAVSGVTIDAVRASALGFLVLGLTCGAATYLWVTGGWFHLELLPISGYVRLRGWMSVFDWQIFDSNADRLRPLSDFFEVFDAMLRPHTVWLFGHHPSAALSSVGMAIASAALFYKSLRYFGHSRNVALIMTALLISTIGFQSCFVAYIRPAKRLALFGVCAMLFLTGRYTVTKKRTDFALICVATLLVFLTDETGFVLWLVTALLLIPCLRGWRTVTFASLPVFYFVLIRLILPPIYEQLGTDGPRTGAVNHVIIEKLLSNLLSPDFYVMAATDLDRSLATTLGVITPYEWVALSIVAIVLCVAIYKARWIVVATSLSLIGTSGFLSMIDMANGPDNTLAKLTYYYHSAVSPLAIFWIASILNWIEPIKLRPALGMMATALIALNFVNFHRINELTKIFHTYPMTTFHPMTFDEVGLQSKFNYLLSDGRPFPEQAWFRKAFSNYQAHPMGDESYARNLAKAFDPR